MYNYVNKKICFNVSRACAQKSVILLHKFYSTDSISSNPLIPVKVYANAALLKKEILLDNKGLSGIYR
jgi:hypothetical protein